LYSDLYLTSRAVLGAGDGACILNSFFTQQIEMLTLLCEGGAHAILIASDAPILSL
jgi:hypothetical protein